MVIVKPRGVLTISGAGIAEGPDDPFDPRPVTLHESGAIKDTGDFFMGR
ncbi:hypothetical protein [Methanofollis aquaemaris]|nr:hypothetical protein [Methanofollis aquaemaris]